MHSVSADDADAAAPAARALRAARASQDVWEVSALVHVLDQLYMY
jgi:hypothetical protein